MRSPHNPILDASRVGPPSSADLEVVGVFNPGVAKVGEDDDDDIVLLLRVAEAVRNVPKAEVASPIFDAATRKVVIQSWQRTQLDEGGADDSRIFRVRGAVYLSSISHLRRARAKKGSNGAIFTVDPTPTVTAESALEAFGVEDPRITRLDGAWWVTYTAVSSAGIATGLLRSIDDDLRSFERVGIIFAPPNRDVAIFPERIRGRAYALHRPMTHGGLGRPSIWLASSPSHDLRDWGEHRFVAGPRSGQWDDEKIGGGAVPFRIFLDGAKKRPAWLAIYHGVTEATTSYALGALLLDYEQPHVVLARSASPFLSPEAPYEREGFFGRVVFTCGAVYFSRTNIVRIYYGAADGVTCVADVPLATILAGLVFHSNPIERSTE